MDAVSVFRNYTPPLLRGVSVLVGMVMAILGWGFTIWIYTRLSKLGVSGVSNFNGGLDCKIFGFES